MIVVIAHSFFKMGIESVKLVSLDGTIVPMTEVGSGKTEFCFWMSTCPYCIMHLEFLNKKKSSVVAVNLDLALSMAAVDCMKRLTNLSHFYAGDTLTRNLLFREFDIKRIPHTSFVNL